MFNKLRELSKDTAIYGVSTIVARFLGFILVPFYTNVFSTDDFGVYSYLYAVIAFLNIAFIYGMEAAFMKYAANTDGEDKKKIFSTPYIVVFFTSILLSAGIYFSGGFLSSAMGIPGNYSYLTNYAALILFFDTIALIPFVDLRLERKSVRFAVIKTSSIILNLTLNIVLILGYNFGIEAIFISNLSASVFSFIILLPHILSHLKPVVSGEMLRKMLRFGLPYVPASLAAMMVQMIDVPIMRSLTNLDTLGIYRANYKLGIFMMLFVSMFQFAWQPFFLTNAGEKNAKEIFAKVFTIFTLVSGIIWLFLSVFIEDVAGLKVFGRSIIGADYLSGVYIVPVILLGYFFYGMYINFTAGIYIKEKTAWFPAVTGAGALVNVGVNFLLIPKLGILGAAFATLGSYLVMAAGLYLVANRFYTVKYEWRKIIIIISLMIVSGIIYYYLYFEGLLNFYNKLAILVLFVILLFVLRVIKREEIRQAIIMFTGKGKNG